MIVDPLERYKVRHVEVHLQHDHAKGSEEKAVQAEEDLVAEGKESAGSVLKA